MSDLEAARNQALFDPEEAARAWPACPPQFIESLRRYVHDRLRPGHFLSAVLENDLHNAIGHANPATLPFIKDIVGCVYNHVPDIAWGSKAKVTRWLKRQEHETSKEGE